jgi:hypothetical protein
MRNPNINEDNKSTRFSSTNQPTKAAKVEGRRKATLIKDIAKQIVKGGVKNALKPLAEYLGLDVDEINLETVMHLKQMEKAIKEGDTASYNSVMNRIAGKVTEQIDHTSNGEKLNNTTIINLGQGVNPEK